MRCAKHDDSKLKCNGKNKDGKPCSDNALEGMTKCKRHVKEFLGAGGDATLLRRMSDDASGGGVQAALPAAPTSSRDDRIICDSGATNHTAHLGDVVGRLTGKTLCETNNDFVLADRVLTSVPLEDEPQPAVLLNGPRCASVGKLTKKNPEGLPKRMFNMAGDEAGFINDPVLAAKFLHAAKQSGAWVALDVVDDVPLFPARPVPSLAAVASPLPAVSPAAVDALAVVDDLAAFVDACETLEELLQPSPSAVDPSPAAVPCDRALVAVAGLADFVDACETLDALLPRPVSSSAAPGPRCGAAPAVARPARGLGWLGRFAVLSSLFTGSPAHGAPVLEGVAAQWPSTDAPAPSVSRVPAVSGAGFACATAGDESVDLLKHHSVASLPISHHTMTHKGGSSACASGNCTACEAAKMTQQKITSTSGYDRAEDKRLHLDSVGPSRQGATANGTTATHFTLALYPKTKKLWIKLFKKLNPDNTAALVTAIERQLKAEDAALDGLRADGGPEFSGKKLDALFDELGLQVDRAVPGEHAHLIERYVRTVVEGVRAARLAAGLPPSAWPAALEHWIQNWNATEANQTREDCDVNIVPFGVGVRYMPDAEEKVKERRFEANARVGIVIGYASTVPKAYQILDFDLLKSGKWRATTTRAAKPLIHADGEPVFPGRYVSEKERKTIETVFNRRAGGVDGAAQLALTKLFDDIDINNFNATTSQCVTRVIPESSAGYRSSAGCKARQDEADKLNRYECFDWGTLDEWSNVTAHNPTATRVGGRMLLSSKFEELEEIFR